MVELVHGLHHMSPGVTKESPGVVEHELGLHHKSPEVVELVMELHHRNSKGGEARSWATPWVFR